MYSPEERERFVEFFRKAATNISAACKAFRITRKTFYEWYDNDPEFAELINEAREEIKDFGESQLLTLMKGIPELDRNGALVKWKERPDTAAVIFFNKTRNKERGYVERSEIVHDEMARITGIEYIVPDETEDNTDQKTTPSV